MFSKSSSVDETFSVLKKLCNRIQSLAEQFNAAATRDDLRLFVNVPGVVNVPGAIEWQQDDRLITANSYWMISVSGRKNIVRVYLVPSVYLLEIAKHETKDNLRFEIKVTGSGDRLNLSVNNAPLSVDELDTLCLTIFNDLVKRSKSACELGFDKLRLQLGGQSLSGALNDLLLERHSLVRELLNQSDRIQSHVARELHDAVISDLLILKKSLLQEEGNSSSNDYLSIIDGLVSKTRSICSDLHCRDLEDWGLELSLRNLVERLGERSSIEIEYQGPASLPALASAAEMQIYRIVQEGITNAIKHSQASKICVKIEASGERMQVTVSDNGVGIHRKPGAGEGSGLKIMRERAEIISTYHPAQINFESDRQPGFRVVLNVTL